MRMLAIGRPLRGVTAWVGSCFVAAAVLSVGISTIELFELARLQVHTSWYEVLSFPFVVAFSFAGLILSLTSLPALVAVLVIRHFELERGLSDTLIGGLPGYCGLVAAAVMSWEHKWHDGSAVDMLGLGILLLIAGWSAGFAYWLFAGRPRRAFPKP